MNNLAKIRGKHGLSSGELAKNLGVTKQAVSAAENHTISVELAKKASAYLNESIIDIMGVEMLKVVPQTQEDKEKLINLINSL